MATSLGEGAAGEAWLDVVDAAQQSMSDLHQHGALLLL